LPDNGFAQKPKHVASNKSDINVVVIEGLYFPLAVHVSQRDVILKDMVSIILEFLDD
jgi:hypothetical protein